MSIVIPTLPDSAPFTAEQRAWLNGYLAGLLAAQTQRNGSAPALNGTSAPAAAPKKRLLFLFGTQTGTAEALAHKLSKVAATRGFAPEVKGLDAYEKINWSEEKRIAVVTSTYGDGDMPDNAQGFWNHFKTDAAPKLNGVTYSVLAIGDTNYPDFCKAGKDIDARLEQLGATRAHPRTDCDVDYEAPAQTWLDGALSALAGPEGSAASDSIAPAVVAPAEAAPDTAIAKPWSKTNPFPARLITNRLLSGSGAIKETRHFEISLAGSGLAYEVGDALGVVPTNCPELAAEIIKTIGCTGEEPVTVPGAAAPIPLLDALIKSLDITKPSPDFIKYIATTSKNAEITTLLEPGNSDALRKFLYGKDILDLLLLCPGIPWTAAGFAAQLKKIAPRLYSISSSIKANPEQVHLTVSVVRYTTNGRVHKGICSTYLADRAAEPATVPVFIQTSHGFRLPADPKTPIIMVGPGTGVAPFRAFLQERRAIQAPGSNWLIFGEQKIANDFYYREELEDLAQTGYLHKLTTAFSRDQEAKIYVQNRMIEEGAEIWKWLQEGAHFYVCGDASRMAKDVDAALHEIARTHGGMSEDESKAYIQSLKTAKRYQRDVY
ncbi:sulfite reductase subunit alpha [Verrucomicrobia bacterium LW23]|nr:sulfite reductase subunit alpha [Verrucomicrobia bacterium LW23]